LTRNKSMRHPGQGMAEYTLIGSLLVLVAIGALGLLGGQVNTLFGNMLGGSGTAQSTGTVQIANTTTQQSQNTAISTAQQTLINAGIAYDTITTANGVTIQMPVIQGGTTVQTAGASGSQLTYGFSDVLTQIAQKLQDSGQADPALVQLITDLANKGHLIGDNQKFLENCLSTCNSNDLTTSYFDSFNTVTIQLTPEFQTLHQQVLDYTAANPESLPASLITVIDLQARQIENIVQTTASPTSWQATETDPCGPICIDTTESTATLIHQDANTICSSGGDTGQCIQ
jgi:Flp pilus assembly pilin Flp